MRFQQLKRDPNTIMRKKLVKSKKAWVVVSSLSFAGGLLLLGGPNTIAKADVTTESAKVATVVAQSNSVETQDSTQTTQSNNKETNLTGSDTTVNSDSKNTIDTSASSNIDSNTAEKDTKIATNTVTKDDNATPSSEENSTVENDSISTPSGAPVTPAAKISTFSSTTPTDVEDKVILTDSSTTKTSDSASADSNNLKDNEKVTNESVVINPISADLTADKLTSDALATPIFEDTSVTTDSGTGWTYDSTNTTLNITGQLDDFKGGDTEHWGGNTSSITTVKVTAPVKAPTDSSYMFANMTNLKTIDIAKLDTSNTTNMQGMFKNDTNITNIDLSSNNLSTATDISHMFENDTRLTNVDIASGNTTTDPRPGKPFKKLTDASYAFANDINLTNMDSLKSWQGWYLTDLSGMFKDDAKIKSLNLSNLMWTMMGGRPNTGDSSIGEGMFDGTDLQSITLSSSLSFSPKTALTSSYGGQWTSNVGELSGKSFSFLGVPLIDNSGTATSGIGSLYNGKAVSNDITLTYNANKLSDGTTVSNLITINTNHGPISFIAQGTVGQSSTINVPDTFKFEDGNTYTRTSAPTVQVTFNQTQSTAANEATYVGALISNGTATISTNDGNQVVNDISGHIGDTVDITVPTKEGYTPDKSTVAGIIQPDGSVKVTDTVTYIGNEITAPITISTNKGEITVNDVTGKVGDTVDVTVPTKEGYTPDKSTVKATINPDGSITTSDTVKYSGNSITDGKATISSNLGNQEVDNIAGTVDDTVTVTVPIKTGYTPDKTTVSGVIQPDGSVKVTDAITYTGNSITNGSASISSNDGEKTVTDISGKVGDTVDVTVPTKEGYTPDKTTVSGVIQPDGSVKVTDTVTYTGNSITNGSASISSNDGEKTVTGISGKVGDTVDVTVPTKEGYTPDKTTVSGVIQPDGSVKVTDNVTYTGNPITDGSASISSNDGNKTVTGISGKVGDTVDVTVPTKEGYTPDKTTVSGVIQPDGSVKVTDNVTYTGDPITDGSASISSNDGNKTVTGISGKVGDTVNVTVPTKKGYTSDKNTVSGVIQPDGSVKVTDTVTYIGNETTAPVTISTNKGEVTIKDVTGKVGDTVDVTVPNKEGYTPDKNTVKATINPDGSITTIDSITYTGNPITNGSASISSNNGVKTVTGISGKVGDTVDVTVPTKDGYTPDKSIVSGVIQPDGSVKVTDTVTYTGDPITNGSASIPTNDGEKTVTGISGKVGDTVDVTVPNKEGYTPDKNTVSGVIQPDGSVKVTDIVTYTGNSITNGSASIATNNGEKTVTGISGKVGDTVEITVPTKDGYTPDKTTVSGIIQPDGSVKVTDAVTYTGNSITSGSASIPTNDGDKTITGISGKVGDTVDVTVPTKEGYTPDKSIVSGVIQPDGSVKVTDTITYTGVDNPSQTLTVKNPDGTISQLLIPAGKYGDDPVSVTAKEMSGYKAPSVIVTYNADGIPTITDAIDTSKSILETDELSYTKNSSHGSGTVKPVIPNSDEGTIEHKVQTISTYSDKPDVELYQLGADNTMAPITSRYLATASNWYSDATITIDGISYFRVATNEWAKVGEVYPYQALNLHIRTYDDSEKDLYKAENVLITKETLAPDSSWITDRETYVINNTKYYRVATNEFVNANDVYVYSPVNMIVTTHADKYTPLYTAKGTEVTNRTLSNNTSWKVDSVVYINGDKYYRVATNEFVKASDVDVENYR